MSDLYKVFSTANEAEEYVKYLLEESGECPGLYETAYAVKQLYSYSVERGGLVLDDPEEDILEFMHGLYVKKVSFDTFDWDINAFESSPFMPLNGMVEVVLTSGSTSDLELYVEFYVDNGGENLESVKDVMGLIARSRPIEITGVPDNFIQAAKEKAMEQLAD